MRLRRFVTGEAVRGQTCHLRDESLLRHAAVLRLAVGEEVLLCDGEGALTHVRLTLVSKKELRADVLGTQHEALPRPRVTLYQALPSKQSKLEEVLTRCTEVGVMRFVPITSERTVLREVRNTDRLRTLLREATEQSEGSFVPELLPVMPFDAALRDASARGVAILADSYRESPLLRDIASNLHTVTDIALFVGPEGGFSAEEVTRAEQAGVTCISLGRRILRTETAGVVLASIVLASS